MITEHFCSVFAAFSWQSPISVLNQGHHSGRMEQEAASAIQTCLRPVSLGEALYWIQTAVTRSQLCGQHHTGLVIWWKAFRAGRLCQWQVPEGLELWKKETTNKPQIRISNYDPISVAEETFKVWPEMPYCKCITFSFLFFFCISMDMQCIVLKAYLLCLFF